MTPVLDGEKGMKGEFAWAIVKVERTTCEGEVLGRVELRIKDAIEDDTPNALKNVGDNESAWQPPTHFGPRELRTSGNTATRDSQ